MIEPVTIFCRQPIMIIGLQILNMTRKMMEHPLEVWVWPNIGTMEQINNIPLTLVWRKELSWYLPPIHWSNMVNHQLSRTFLLSGNWMQSFHPILPEKM